MIYRIQVWQIDFVVTLDILNIIFELIVSVSTGAAERKFKNSIILLAPMVLSEAHCQQSHGLCLLSPWCVQLLLQLLQQTSKRQIRRVSRGFKPVVVVAVEAKSPNLGPKPLHLSVLHTSDSSRLGHLFPSSIASLITSLPLVLVPPPQVTLQSFQAFQSPTLQST